LDALLYYDSVQTLQRTKKQESTVDANHNKRSILKNTTMAPRKETSGKRKKATYGKRRATKHYDNADNNSTKRKNIKEPDKEYSGTEEEVATTIKKKAKIGGQESAAIERDVETATPKKMKVSVGKFKEHRSIVPSSKEAATKGKIVPMPAKAPKPRMIVPSSANTEKTEIMVPSSAASFNFPGDSDDDDDDDDVLHKAPANAAEIVSSGVIVKERRNKKRKSKGTPTRAFINWNEEHGNAASLANEKHNVRVFVNNHLFSKVKFITKDSQLDYNGKMPST